MDDPPERTYTKLDTVVTPRRRSSWHEGGDSSRRRVSIDPFTLNPEANEMANNEINDYLVTTAFTRDAVRRVGRCDGSKAADTLRWLRAVGECQRDRKAVILETSEGPLKDFVLNLTGLGDWRYVKQAIAEQFVSADFVGMQQRALREMKQRPDENLASFSYQFMQTMQEAYPEPHIPNDEVVRLYINALAEKSVARAVLKKFSGLPPTLEDAIRLAKEESTFSDFLVPKPIANPKKEKLIAAVGLEEQIKEIKDQLLDLKVGIVSAAQQAEQKGRNSCFRCGKAGHFANECKAKVKVGLVCLRCRRPGHVVARCQTPVPNTPCPACRKQHWLFDCPIKPKESQKSSDSRQPLN